MNDTSTGFPSKLTPGAVAFGLGYAAVFWLCVLALVKHALRARPGQAP